MVHGYKAFEKDWTCLDKQYTCPGLFEEEGKLEICRNGIHFCRNCTENPEREERAPYDVPLKFYFESRFKVYDGKLIEQIPSFNVFF